MEILYIYIEKYKALRKLGLNFGGAYRFTYDEEKNILRVQENEMYIKDFYCVDGDGAKILNVSSVIGENGTGKSSILQFIKDNISRGKSLEYPAILVMKEGEAFKVYSTYWDVEVDNENFSIEFIENPNEGEIFNFGYDFRGFPSTDVIFFSNIFDGTPGGSMMGLYDISSNGLIYEDYRHNVEQRIIGSEEDHIAIFITEDIYRQLVLITSDIPRDLFPFRLPETLVISIYDIINSFSKDSTESKEFEKLKDAVKKHYISEYLKTDDLTILEDTTSSHINYLIAAVLESLVRELLHTKERGASLGFDFRFTGEFILKEGILTQYLPYEERIDYFFDQVNSQVKSGVNIESVKDLIANSETFVKFILKNRDIFYNHSFNPRDPITLVDIYKGDISNEEVLKEFMMLYRKTFMINQYLKFSWTNLSTGENALLNIYSRFYSLSDSAKKAGELESHLILLIDEGDTYLHPAWQKKLLFNLLKFLPVAYSRPGRQRSIQLIMTTNSAIPASDFFSYNTIFLKKEGNDKEGYKTTVRDSLNEQKQTFSANIHTLLSDSFFISDGLRGDFANYKIEQVIQYLKGDKNIVLSEDNVFNLIEQIGEPLIKNSLKELFYSRFPSKINEEIKRLTELQKKYEGNK